MAQTTTSAPQQGVAMPAVDLRQMVGALVAVEGVRTSTDLLVSQRGAGANMSVDIAGGSCVITDDHASGGGVYSFTLGSTLNVAVGTANGTNPRIDRVVVTVLDNALGDASNSATVSVVAGTATSGATLTNLSGAAAVPSSALLLANVLVPTSATSVVTANIANVVSTVKVVGASGSQLDRKTITADVSGIVATTEGTASTVITGNTVAYDGTEVKVEFWAPGYKNAGSANRIFLVLLYDATVIGQAVVMSSTAASDNEPIKAEAFHTPSAGSHTYSVKAFVDSASFSGTVRAGTGGSGTLLPAVLRVTKA